MRYHTLASGILVLLLSSRCHSNGKNYRRCELIKKLESLFLSSSVSDLYFFLFSFRSPIVRRQTRQRLRLRVLRTSEKKKKKRMLFVFSLSNNKTTNKCADVERVKMKRKENKEIKAWHKIVHTHRQSTAELHAELRNSLLLCFYFVCVCVWSSRKFKRETYNEAGREEAVRKRGKEKKYGGTKKRKKRKHRGAARNTMCCLCVGNHHHTALPPVERLSPQGQHSRPASRYPYMHPGPY